MALFDQEHRPPDRGPGDTVHSVVKTAISSVPIVGKGAAEIFATIIAAPLDRRRAEWASGVGAALRELSERKGLDLTELQTNEQFLDIAFQATQAAVRTSQQDKQRALRNALLNAARPSSIDAEQQAVFVRLIESLTDWHIRILRALQEPGKHARGMGGLWQVVAKAHPEMADHRERVDQVCVELNAHGLLAVSNLHVTLSDVGASKRTTPLGDKFLVFIASPLEET